MSNISTNTFSWKKATILSIGVGLLVAGLSIVFQVQGKTAHEYVAADARPVAVLHEADGLGSAFDMPGKPVRLVIHAIDVDAKIQSVGLSWREDGTMGVPSNFTDVGWYNKGPLPGAPGSAVIDGHFDGKNTPRAVFYDLDKLKVGDLVEVIDAKGRALHFKVVGSKTYDYKDDAADIFFGDTSKARLNLITCAGDWMAEQKLYRERIVVFTELVPTEAGEVGTEARRPNVTALI